jgi:hypothetical protein
VSGVRPQLPGHVQVALPSPNGPVDAPCGQVFREGDTPNDDLLGVSYPQSCPHLTYPF